MYNANIIAKLTDKRTGFSTEIEVMRMNYKIDDNTLWITKVTGTIIDFDLNEFDVEIKTIKE